MIRLMIKSESPDQALAFMKSRSLPVVGITSQYKSESTFSNTVDSAWKSVADWFAEPPHGAPFPLGTLLHYSMEEKTEPTLILGMLFRELTAEECNRWKLLGPRDNLLVREITDGRLVYDKTQRILYEFLTSGEYRTFWRRCSSG